MTRADFADMAVRAEIGAAALAQGRSIDLWSLTLTALALACLWWMPSHTLPLCSQAFLFISVLAGGVQKIFALRVAFDEDVFRYWARCWSTVEPDLTMSDPTTILAAFDRVLASCGLRSSEHAAPRDLDNRLQGALKLLRGQTCAFTTQFVAWLVAIATTWITLPG